MWKNAEEFLLNDKYIGPLIKKWGGCTIKPLSKSIYFEDLVDAICSQQLSGKAAKTIFGRVKEKLAGSITPDPIIKIDTKELRKCGLSYAKCSYVKDLAQKVKSGELQISKLDELPDEEVIKELTAVKGIGRWTAEMFLMFSLGRPDIFPVDDLGIKKGLRLVEPQGSERFENKEHMKEFAQRWAPYRTIASWYLWRSLENR